MHTREASDFFWAGGGGGGGGGGLHKDMNCAFPLKLI